MNNKSPLFPERADNGGISGMDKFNVFDVSSALIDRIRRDYADDIAIAAYYGSYLDGTATERSDLDFFFIPANPQGEAAALSFLVNGISFDFWPLSWERAERMSKLEDGQAGILADCKLLYMRGDEELDRFNDLKLRIKDLRSFEGEEAFIALAESKLQAVYPILHDLRRRGTSRPLSEYRLQAYELMTAAFEVVALLNRTYLRKSWGRSLPQLYALPIRPTDLEATVHTLLRSADIPDIVAACGHLTDSLRALIAQRRSETQSGTPDHVRRGRGFFEAFQGQLNQVQSACERKDYEVAFFAAAQADADLHAFLVFCETGIRKSGADAMREGRSLAERAKLPQLTSLLDPASLIPLQSAAHRLGIALERYLREQGVDILKFEALDEFRAFLRDRP